MCNYAPLEKGYGTYRCEECDFDTCEGCYTKEL